MKRSVKVCVVAALDKAKKRKNAGQILRRAIEKCVEEKPRRRRRR